MTKPDLDFRVDASVIRDWANGRAVDTQTLLSQFRLWLRFLGDEPALELEGEVYEVVGDESVWGDVRSEDHDLLADDLLALKKEPSRGPWVKVTVEVTKPQEPW